MEDWRYENLRDDIRRAREETREVRERTYRIESWQSLLPLRVMFGVCWLFSAGMIVFALARATH